MMGPKGKELFEMHMKMDKLMKENEYLKKRKTFVSFKVNDKGGIIIYGISEFPIHLFPEQILNLLDKAPELRKFIEDNKELLS